MIATLSTSQNPKKNPACDFEASSKTCPASCFLDTARDALKLGATQKKPCS
jgi:hypothetical protein